MGTPGHMRLPHRLQGQKVKSQGGAGAYCGGHLAAQLVTFGTAMRAWEGGYSLSPSLAVPTAYVCSPCR